MSPTTIGVLGNCKARKHTFLRSRVGSFSALITSAAAEGTTETLAIRFCTVSLHVTRRPFHSFAVSLAMSSPARNGLQSHTTTILQQPAYVTQMPVHLYTTF